MSALLLSHEVMILSDLITAYSVFDVAPLLNSLTMLSCRGEVGGMNEGYSLGQEYKLVKISLLNIQQAIFGESLKFWLKRTQKYDVASRNQAYTTNHFVTK